MKECPSVLAKDIIDCAFDVAESEELVAGFREDRVLIAMRVD